MHGIYIDFLILPLTISRLDVLRCSYTHARCPLLLASILGLAPLSSLLWKCKTRNKASLAMGYHHSRLRLWGWTNPIYISLYFPVFALGITQKQLMVTIPPNHADQTACDASCCQLYSQVVFHRLGVFIGRTHVIPA